MDVGIACGFVACMCLWFFIARSTSLYVFSEHLELTVTVRSQPGDPKIALKTELQIQLNIIQPFSIWLRTGQRFKHKSVLHRARRDFSVYLAGKGSVLHFHSQVDSSCHVCLIANKDVFLWWSGCERKSAKLGLCQSGNTRNLYAAVRKCYLFIQMLSLSLTLFTHTHFFVSRFQLFSGCCCCPL